MKKVFFVSLLLVSIFLIGNAEFAAAQCSDYQDYQCTGTVTQYGEIVEIFNDCVELCYFDDGVVGIYKEFGSGYLYPVTGSKNLLGTYYDYTYYWTGCSVEFKGKSIISKFAYIEDDSGYVVTDKCKPCNDCCH